MVDVGKSIKGSPCSKVLSNSPWQVDPPQRRLLPKLALVAVVGKAHRVAEDS